MVKQAMRFIHTADWQIGMKAANVPQVADKVRMARLEVIDRIGRLVEEREADFVVVAGDVFEHNQVGRQCARDVLRRLGSYPVDVYIVPGNHDCAGAGSIYTTSAFLDTPSNVHVLIEREPVVIERPGVTLYPCPVTQKRTMLDPTDWIPSESSMNTIRIAVAHGSVRELGIGDPDDNPISLAAVASKRIDYLALGHWHSTMMLSSRAYYSGTPEQTSFSERDSGNVLVVSIDRPGSEPVIEPVRVGKLAWVEIEHELTGPWQDSLGRLRDTLDCLSSDPSNTLLRLRLTGISDGETLAKVDDLLDDFRPAFLHIDVNKSGLLLDIDEDKLSEWASTRPLAWAVVSDLRRLMRQSAADEAAAAFDIEDAGLGDSQVDLAEVLENAKLPEDEDWKITREEVQAALAEMLKALGGISR